MSHHFLAPFKKNLGCDRLHFGFNITHLLILTLHTPWAFKQF